MAQRHKLSFFLVALFSATTLCYVVLAQQQPAKQSLGDVLHQALDKDKDGKVTWKETQGLLKLLDNVNRAPQGGENDPEVEKYNRLLSSVKAGAPTMFDMLDADPQDGGLTKKELSYVTKFVRSLKKDGGMRDFVRYAFATVDADGDDQITSKEIVEAAKDDEVVSKLAYKFHDLLPFRRSAEELDRLFQNFIEYFGAGKNSLDEEASAMAEGIVRWFDDDGDGIVQRKEVGRHYKEAGLQFLEISKLVKEMGPMLAMFGGMDMNNMNNGGAKMDL